MTDTETTTIDTYFELWNETDQTRRADLVAQVFADDGRHVDPLADVAGHGPLSEMVGGVQARFPGHVVRRTSAVDTHHDQLRYAWELAAPDGSIVVSALDVAQFDDAGKIRHVAAFFGPLGDA